MGPLSGRLGGASSGQPGGLEQQLISGAGAAGAQGRGAGSGLGAWGGASQGGATGAQSCGPRQNQQGESGELRGSVAFQRTAGAPSSDRSVVLSVARPSAPDR